MPNYLFFILCVIYDTYIVLTALNILVFKAVQTYKLKHNFVVCKYILNFVWSAQTVRNGVATLVWILN